MTLLKRYAVAATVVALAGFALFPALLTAGGAPAQEPEPMVYDPDLGETVPAELRDALRDSVSLDNTPGEEDAVPRPHPPAVNEEPPDDPDPVRTGRRSR